MPEFKDAPITDNELKEWKEHINKVSNIEAEPPVKILLDLINKCFLRIEGDRAILQKKTTQLLAIQNALVILKSAVTAG